MVALEVHYNASHVILTLGMAFIGSFSSVSLCEQYRLATLSVTKKKRHLVLVLVALALGWGATWSTLAVGFSSIKLYNGDVKVPIRYNPVIVVLAVIQGVVQMYIGMVIASTDECFNKSRTDIIEMFVTWKKSAYTLEEVKKLTKWQIFYIVCTHSLERLIIGGFLAGSAVAAMFYTMLQSLEFEGKIEYNAGIIVASFLFAIFNGVGSFWTFFRLLSLLPSLDFLRGLTASLGINAIGGMFYIGMAALTFTYNPDTVKAEPPTSSGSIRPGNLYTGGVCSCVVLVCVMLMFVVSDLRSWLLRTSTQLRQADKVITVLTRKLRAASKNQSTPLELVQYARVYQNQDRRDSSTETSATSSVHSTSGTGRGSGAKRYHSLYNDYDEEDAADSETGSNPSNSVHERDSSSFSPRAGARAGAGAGAGDLRVQCLEGGEYARVGRESPVPHTAACASAEAYAVGELQAKRVYQLNAWPSSSSKVLPAAADGNL